MRPVAIVASIVAAAALAPAAAGADEQSRLDAAKKRWKAFAARDYTYVVTRTCSRCVVEPARIRVRSGKPRGTPDGYTSMDTVEELFRRIQRAIDDHPFQLTVDYGRRSGVPTLVSIDEERLTVDDVSGFVLKGFRRT